jgi:adenylate kinase
MYIVLIGPPASGKGTQAKILSKILDIPHVSTGDLLRKEVRSGSTVGKHLDDLFQRGQLAPDDVTNKLVNKRLAQDDAKEGVVFDGYPRSVAQVKALNKMLASRGRKVDHVLFFDLKFETISDRIVHRRSNPETGEVFHLKTNPPPEDYEGTLIQRDDDTEDIVRLRHKTYKQETEPVIKLYSKMGKLTKIDGSLPVSEITKKVLEALYR